MTRFTRKGKRLGKQNAREPKDRLLDREKDKYRKKAHVTTIREGLISKGNSKEILKHIEKIDDLMDDGFWGFQAGMADGDGYFYKNRLRYGLSLTDIGPIKQLSDLYGTTITRQEHADEKLSDSFTTILDGNRALHFMLKVCPYLIEKREKVTELINMKIPEYHPPKIPMNIDTWSIHMGYLAGAMDAEGTVNCYPTKFHSSKNPGPYMRHFMKITNTNLRFLKKIQRFLMTLPFKWTTKDVPIRTRPRKQKKYNGELCKTAYDLEFNRKTQGIMASMLMPLLQIKRKRHNLQKFLLLRDVDNMISKGKKYPNIKPLKTKLGPSQIG